MFQTSAYAGYYTDFLATNIEDFFLCEPGYYCPTGTSLTKYKQNTCLQGFYCPRGTAASIDMYTGGFKTGSVYQVSNQDIIIAIQTMLRLTNPVLKAYDLNYVNK